MRIFFYLIAFLAPLAVFAQGDAFIPLTNLPEVATIGNDNSLPTFFNTIYKLCIGAAAVIAVLQIMRAGTKFFFNTGSVAQNQEAKRLITNSILGLLLVLSPAIVFGIINPDILGLDLNISRLKLDPLQQQTIPANNNTQDASQCSQYTAGDMVASYGSCSSLGQGYTQVSNACCQNYQVGSTCCARPKSTPQEAESEYMWRVVIETPSIGFGNPSSKTHQGGPFKTQTECNDSYAIFRISYSGGTVQCDCSKPRSEFPACKS